MRSKRSNKVQSLCKHHLDFKPNPSSTSSTEKSGLLRVHVMKASVHSQHQKLMNNLKKSCRESENFGPNSLVKQLQSLGKMFAPPKNADISQINETPAPQPAMKRDQPSERELIESLNYVLPIEKFNHFKILLPKSKLHVTTPDGEEVIVEPCDKHTKVKATHETHEGLMKRHKTTKDVLQLFSKQKSRQLNANNWRKDDSFFIYVFENKKFLFDKSTGEISCFPTPDAMKPKPSNKSKGEPPQLERNIVGKSFGTFINDFCKKPVEGKEYPSTNQFNVRSNHNIQLHVLQPVEQKANFRFVIHSSPFGSFIERAGTSHIATGNRKQTARKNNRDYKDREEEKLIELIEQIPNQYLPDKKQRNKYSIVRGSIDYIKDLERKVREQLGIPQASEDPLDVIETAQTTDHSQHPMELSASQEDHEDITEYEEEEVYDNTFEDFFQLLCNPISSTRTTNHGDDEGNQTTTIQFPSKEECSLFQSLSAMEQNLLRASQEDEQLDRFVSIEERFQLNYSDVNLNSLQGEYVINDENESEVQDEVMYSAEQPNIMNSPISKDTDRVFQSPIARNNEMQL